MAWKHPFAWQKPALQAERSQLDNPTKDQKLEAVNIFFSNQTLQSALTTIQRKKKYFTLEDLTIVSSYLFCSLVYRNWRWPGAAINLTTDEAAGAVERDGHLIIHSWKHKTVLARGLAVMVLHPDNVAIFQHYRNSWGRRMLLLAHQPAAATSFFSTRTTGRWITIGMQSRVSVESSTTLHCRQQQQCAKLEPPRWLALTQPNLYTVNLHWAPAEILLPN